MITYWRDRATGNVLKPEALRRKYAHVLVEAQRKGEGNFLHKVADPVELDRLPVDAPEGYTVVTDFEPFQEDGRWKIRQHLVPLPNRDHFPLAIRQRDHFPLAIRQRQHLVPLPNRKREVIAGELKAKLYARLADKRFRVETGGIRLGGEVVRTDRESRELLTQAVVYVTRAGDVPTHWKTVDGWRLLSRSQLFTMHDRVQEHVRACFEREHEIADQIAAAQSIADLKAIDHKTGWPPHEGLAGG